MTISLENIVNEIDEIFSSLEELAGNLDTINNDTLSKVVDWENRGLTVADHFEEYFKYRYFKKEANNPATILSLNTTIGENTEGLIAINKKIKEVLKSKSSKTSDKNLFLYKKIKYYFFGFNLFQKVATGTVTKEDFIKTEISYPAESLVFFATAPIDDLLYSTSLVNKLKKLADKSLELGYMKSYESKGSQHSSQDTEQPPVKLKENGDFIINGEIIVSVKPSTHEYFFLEILCKHYDFPVSHEDIYQCCLEKAVQVDEENKYTPQTFCNKYRGLIKKRIVHNKKDLFKNIIKPTKTVDGDNAYKLALPR